MQIIKNATTSYARTFKNSKFAGKIVLAILPICTVCICAGYTINILTPDASPTPITQQVAATAPQGIPAPEVTSQPPNTSGPTDIPTSTATPAPPMDTPTVTNTPEPTLIPTVTNTPEPTLIPTVTNTPEPTLIPTVTNTPEPTVTPTQTPTPLPTPTPIILSGSGDSVVNLDKQSGPALLRITGNAASAHFAVISYGPDGQQIDLLVNTTDPYNGIRPIDFADNQATSRLEISATGDWAIEILDLLAARVAIIPGEIQGSGDEVLIVSGAPDTAAITGNQRGVHFAVFGYGAFKDLLVNTTDPYDGVIILDRDTLLLEIIATGPWSISFTAAN